MAFHPHSYHARNHAGRIMSIFVKWSAQQGEYIHRAVWADAPDYEDQKQALLQNKYEFLRAKPAEWWDDVRDGR